MFQHKEHSTIATSHIAKLTPSQAQSGLRWMHTNMDRCILNMVVLQYTLLDSVSMHTVAKLVANLQYSEFNWVVWRDTDSYGKVDRMNCVGW